MSVNSAIGLFGSGDIPVALTVLTPTLNFPAGIASNTGGSVLAGYVVPEGTWLIAGVVSGQITTVGNIIETADLIISKNGTSIYNPFVASNAFACGVPASAVFVSDGNDVLSVTLACLVSGGVNPTTWFVNNNAVGETNLTLIKIK